MPLVERTWQEQFWSFWRGLEIIHQRSGCENYPSNEQQAVAICGKKGQRDDLSQKCEGRQTAIRIAKACPDTAIQ